MTETDPVIDVVPDETLVARGLLISQIIKVLMDRKKATANELFERMSKGSKLTGRDPRTDLSLGTVSMSDPKPEAVVVDRQAFGQWVREQYDDQLESGISLGPLEEVAAVLQEHAPHLLVVDDPKVPDWLTKQVLELAATHPIPGTARRAGPGVVSMRPNAEAAVVVADLLAGSPIRLLEIEGK